MKRVQLLAVGKIGPELLEGLAAAIPRVFPARCEILRTPLSPAPAFHGERLQYHSSELLERMQPLVEPDCWRLLGLTTLDLYIPILTFVFGEAQMGGPCAIVSCHRLRQEAYGLPPDPELLRERLLKEAIHELGHTVELTHCNDYRCVMASSHNVEEIDLKASTLCLPCRRELERQMRDCATNGAVCSQPKP
jgi:archaemetzincin